MTAAHRPAHRHAGVPSSKVDPRDPGGLASRTGEGNDQLIGRIAGAGPSSPSAAGRVNGREGAAEIGPAPEAAADNRSSRGADEHPRRATVDHRGRFARVLKVRGPDGASARALPTGDRWRTGKRRPDSADRGSGIHRRASRSVRPGTPAKPLRTFPHRRWFAGAADHHARFYPAAWSSLFRGAAQAQGALAKIAEGPAARVSIEDSDKGRSRS